MLSSVHLIPENIIEVQNQTQEIMIDLKQNPDWRIAICTRNKNINNPEKRQSTCQWYQTGRCPDRRACHAEKKEFKVSYTH